MVFVGATPDKIFRAFDSATGKLLWQKPLPAAAHSVPMSYELDGRQYVVVAAGGHAKLDPNGLGDYVFAFALPE